MAEEVKIIQIYFSPESHNNCNPKWSHYDNTGKLTPFFENSVISEVVKSKQWVGDSDYIGVFSHDIQKEITFKENGKPLTPESLTEVVTESGCDFYSFQKRRQQKNILLQAENYHPGIVDMSKKILNAIGYDIPKQLDRIVLFNHFVARKEVYQAYVEEMLDPAMEVMKGMEELHKDAGYKNLKRGEHPDFTSQLGYSHYPYHPFILERFPSVWLHYNKQLTFKQIY